MFRPFFLFTFVKLYKREASGSGFNRIRTTQRNVFLDSFWEIQIAWRSPMSSSWTLTSLSGWTTSTSSEVETGEFDSAEQ
jgi:hypothetical protein